MTDLKILTSLADAFNNGRVLQQVIYGQKILSSRATDSLCLRVRQLRIYKHINMTQFLKKYEAPRTASSDRKYI